MNTSQVIAVRSADPIASTVILVQINAKHALLDQHYSPMEPVLASKVNTLTHSSKRALTAMNHVTHVRVKTSARLVQLA